MSMDGFVPAAQVKEESKGENSYLVLKRLPLAGSKDIIGYYSFSLLKKKIQIVLLRAWI